METLAHLMITYSDNTATNLVSIKWARVSSGSEEPL
ncbi:MAG: serine hydrolase [Pirellula sp.]